MIGVAETALALPRFTSNPVTSATEDSSYQYNISTTDMQSGQRQVTATVLPAWLTLTNINVQQGSARLAGTPTQAHVGTHAVSLQVRNLSTNATALQTFSIVVANVNDAPVITGQTPNPIPLQQGTPLTITLSHLVVTDVDDAYPSGFTLTVLNGSNYSRSGNTITPTANFVGTLTVGVRVNDGEANSDTFNLAINVASNNQPPVSTAPIPDQRGVEDAAFQLRDANGAAVTLAAYFRDPNAGDTLRYDVTGLPSSLSANATTGQITGVPRAADVRATPYVIGVTASDNRGAASARQTFNLSIMAADRADLSLGVSATPAPGLVEAPVEWRFAVGNAGPAASGSRSLTAEFAGNPFGFTELGPCSVTPAADRQQLACTVASIAAGATSTVVLRGAASQDGDVHVRASIAASATGPADPTPANNTATTTLHIARVANGTPAQRLSTRDAAGVAAGDVDGDGFTDVVLAGATGGVELYLNVVDTDNPARRKLAALPVAIGPASPVSNVLLVNLDRDADLDLVATNSAGGANTVYMNGGAAAFTPAATLAGGASHSVAGADFDGDGLTDLAFANNGANAIFLNRGGGVFSRVSQLDNDDSRDVLAVDLDLDGLQDLVFANANGPSRFYRNLGGGSFATGVVVDSGGAHSVAGADFNRDGRTDLVFGVLAAAGPPSNPVYQNNPGTAGSPVFLLLTRLGAAPTVRVLTADLDADSIADVVTLNTTGTHQVYRGSGAGSFTLHPVQFSFDAAAAAAAKVSVDSSIDLAIGGATGGAVFLNDGRGGLGLGDTTVPIIQLLGEATVSLTVGSSYQDPGATATDDIDGNITARITTNNPVNTAIVGTYRVTYDVRDSSGNAATRVTRSVEIAAREGTGGGGGGAVEPLTILLLAWLAVRRRRGSRDIGTASTAASD